MEVVEYPKDNLKKLLLLHHTVAIYRAYGGYLPATITDVLDELAAMSRIEQAVDLQ